MTQNKDYAKAVKTANAFMDKMFDMFGLDNSGEYHITEDELKEFAEQISKSKDTTTECIKNIRKNIKFDFSDLKNVVTELMDKYPMCLDHLDVEIPVEDIEACYEDDIEAPITSDDILELHDEDYCASVYERLKRERDAEMSDPEDNEDTISVTYEDMLADIHVILDDPEDPDYEIVHNDELDKDLVHITYYVGYDSDNEFNTYMDYANNIKRELMNLYGFPNVYVMSANNEEDCKYITFNFYCEL